MTQTLTNPKMDVEGKMPLLKIRYPDDRTSELEMTGAEMVIGRDASCDVPLDDEITSRRHARIYRDSNGQYWIQDLHSKNGTLINKNKITTARVRSGDQIDIGNCRLTLTTDEGPSVVLSDAEAGGEFATTSAWPVDQRLDLPRQRLEKLYELNARLTGRFDRDDLLNEVLDICAELLHFERAGIAVWPGEGHQLQWIKLKDIHAGGPTVAGGLEGPQPEQATEFRISRSLVDRALHDGERILITDTAEVDLTASMVSNNIRSAMCVPMEYLQNVRGVIYGDRVTSTGSYNREDIDFFAALGRLAAQGLANAQLVEELQRRQQIDMQLQMGRQIQAQLFPTEPLTLTRESQPASLHLTIDALNDPGQKISGDYYDYFLRDDGLVVVVIADVVGKGVPASLLMANLQAAVRVTMMAEVDLVHIVERLNRLICRNVADSRFITAIFGLLDPAARKFTCVNAGHPPPYLLYAGGRVEKAIVEAGLPLGIEPDYHYEAGMIEMRAAPTDPMTMFLYTDGVPEAENEQGKMFEENRLVSTLEANVDPPPGELVTRVRRSIKQFSRNYPQSDDITMVAVRLETNAAGPRSSGGHVTSGQDQ